MRVVQPQQMQLGEQDIAAIKINIDQETTSLKYCKACSISIPNPLYATPYLIY